VKQELCKAFCDSVSVTELPCGFGISTTLFEIEGDPAGLYAIGPDSTGHWKLEDAGRLLPSLIASGYDLASDQRRKALASILETADAAFDEDGLEISTGPISKSDIPAHAIRLIVALVRVSDLVQKTCGQRFHRHCLQTSKYWRTLQQMSKAQICALIWSCGKLAAPRWLCILRRMTYR
jgi:hypothetical protein